MSWADRDGRRATRLVFALAIAGLCAGCFQPLYGTQASYDGRGGVGTAMRNVEVAEIMTPQGTRLSRVGVEVRNELMSQINPNGSGTHRLEIGLGSSQLQVIVDINTARPDIQNYGIDATFTLTEVATNKKVIKGQTFSRVSYDIPGQQQRFAGERGLRDAENRAAKVIADQIRSRLASYFAAGT